MISKAAIAIFGLAAAALSLPAAAQMRTPSLSAAYLGASIGQGKQKFDCAGASTCDQKDTAWRVFGGYKFHPNFAAELGYANLGTAKAGDAGGSVDVESTAWDLSALGAFPLGSGFSLFGRLGAYHGKVEISGAGSAEHSKNGLTYGLGAQYDFTRNIGARAEWQRYHKMGGGDVGDEFNVDVLSVGALYSFQ